MISEMEIRCGNTILHNGIADNIKEIGLANGKTIGQGDFNNDSDTVKPYALSTIVLISLCGFKAENYGLFVLTDDGEYTYKSKILLTVKQCFIHNEWVWDICKGFFPNLEHIAYIKYLHELENIYYWNFGKKELRESHLKSIHIL